MDTFVHQNFSCQDCDLDMSLVSRGRIYGTPAIDDASCVS